MCFVRWHNKERLLPYTTLPDWFCITDVESVYCAVGTESLYKRTHLAFKVLSSEGAVPGHKTKGVWSWQITSIQRRIWEKRKLYFITSKRFHDAHEMHDISYKLKFLLRSQSKNAALLPLAPLRLPDYSYASTGTHLNSLSLCPYFGSSTKIYLHIPNLVKIWQK
jgi:hypothetical protein